MWIISSYVPEQRIQNNVKTERETSGFGLFRQARRKMKATVMMRRDILLIL